MTGGVLTCRGTPTCFFKYFYNVSNSLRSLKICLKLFLFLSFHNFFEFMLHVSVQCFSVKIPDNFVALSLYSFLFFTCGTQVLKQQVSAPTPQKWPLKFWQIKKRFKA